MTYQFLDAYGSVLTAASNAVGGAQQPIVQVSSISGTVSATITGSPSVSGTVNIAGAASVSGVGVFSVTNVGNGSVLTVPTGSTVAVIQSASVAGTYSEDAAHATGDRGLFTLAVRNDAMSSMTSANGDYSPRAVGPVGETLVANSPIINWIQGQTSVMYGASVQAIAAQGSSVFTYVTAVQVANNSANGSLVKFTGGLGSVLAWTIAPANGGSNIVFPNALKTGANSGFSASISGVSSVYVSAQGFTSNI